MIDIHCHLLPGIDDGPASMEEALKLAEIASRSGITRAVATPHIHHGRYGNDKNRIRNSFDGFSKELRKRGIPLLLGFSAEVRIGPEILPMIERDEIPFLGEIEGCNVMLLEFPHGHIPMGSERLAKWLLARKIIPMIAHPERNKDVIREPGRIMPFVRMGCMLQVTAGSVAGLFGGQAQKTSHHLLKEGLVFALASDAHNANHRPPELEPGRRCAERIVGESFSWNLVYRNPLSLLLNE